MPDTSSVSPLLDGLTLGSPMSARPGVTCLPAIRENSEKRYIVKQLTFPPSQVQLDALLLTGAYKDPAEAMDYFRLQAEDAAKEADILRDMAALEGFLSYEGCQTVPLEDGKLGYQVTLLGSYKRSLEKFCQKTPITHLAAVNLGLDLSAALAACRRAGYLYIDLKPGNIFLSANGKEFRIGDLGFASLDDLKFGSMPQRYYSPYTAPEVHASLDALSETMDVYALGMILYEIYNGGILPKRSDDIPEPLAPPAYADSAMAEILLKATAPDPKDRYESPTQFGQALADYLQKETVNDVPIAPLAPPKKKRRPIRPVKNEPDTPTEPASAPDLNNGLPLTETNAASPVPEATDSSEDLAPKGGNIVSPEVSDVEAKIPAEVPASQDPPEEENPVSTPQEAAEDTPCEQMPPDTDIPPEVQESEEPEVDSFEAELQAVNDLLSTPQLSQKNASPPVPNEAPKKSGGKVGKFFVTLLVLAILAAAAYFGYRFYQTSYLQTIRSITVTGSQNEMTVTVDTPADPQLITVICTDTSGNTKEQHLTGNSAQFTDLTPDTLYNIRLEISGLHKLVGQISDIYTTPGETSILEFNAVTGTEAGSVDLSITIQGYEPESWSVTCSADGEEPITQSFSGKSVSVSGLTVGKTYLISLSANEDILLSGKTQVEFTAMPVLTAENLNISSVVGGVLTAQWDAPAEGEVASWSVRCYCDGFDETITATDTQAEFQIGSAKGPYTVEVTAQDMTQMVRTTLSSDPIAITSWDIDDSGDSSITVSWEYEGTQPENGWLLLYTIDGGTTQNVVKCQESTGTIDSKLPGATYNLTVQSADSTSIFNNTYDYSVPEAEMFEGHGFTGYKVTAKLLPTPEDMNWRKETISSDAYTTSFTADQSISLVLHVEVRFYLDHEDQQILYVVRDSDGKVYKNLYTTAKADWYDIWFDGDYRYGELNGPQVPDEPGSYRLDVYFNGMIMTSQNFTVTG